MKLLKNSYPYFIAFLIFFIPRIVALGSDISNYDASYWYPRLDDFAKNITEGDFKDTYQKYHPGVTVLWLSGMPKYAFEQLVEWKYNYNPRFMPFHFIKLNFVTIFPLIIVISLLGTLNFFFIKNILNNKFAYMFTIMLSVEPFFLGVSKFLHLSALQSILIFSALLSIIYYYDHVRKYKYFYTSAILLGLAFLTKIDTIIALAFVNGLIFYKEYLTSKNLKTIIKNLFLYNLSVVFVFIALFPSLWVTPLSILRKIYQEGVLDTALSDEGDIPYFNIQQLFYIEILFLRSLPTTFLSFITGVFIILYKLKSTPSLLKYFLTFTIFNIVVLTIPDKTIDRYIFNFFPAFIIIAIYPIYLLTKSNKFKILKITFFTLLTGFYLLTVYRYYPVYSYYYTELIGAQPGLYKLGFAIKNRGEYYAQAAQYINKTDNEAVNKTVVLTNREQIRTFQPFFYGTTFTTPKLAPDNKNVDYVISRPEHDHIVPKNLCKLLRGFGPKPPLAYDAVKLYKCEGLTNEYKDFRN